MTLLCARKVVRATVVTVEENVFVMKFKLITFPLVCLCARQNRTCPKSDSRFHPLVQRVTQNFDTFEDFGSNLDGESKTRVHKNSLDQFYDYSYRRVRKPRVPLPDVLDGISEEC